MLNDTSKVQAVGRLTLCPLHEEDMMEAEPSWLDGGILRACDNPHTATEARYSTLQHTTAQHKAQA